MCALSPETNIANPLPSPPPWKGGELDQRNVNWRRGLQVAMFANLVGILGRNFLNSPSPPKYPKIIFQKSISKNFYSRVRISFNFLFFENKSLFFFYHLYRHSGSKVVSIQPYRLQISFQKKKTIIVYKSKSTSGFLVQKMMYTYILHSAFCFDRFFVLEKSMIYFPLLKLHLFSLIFYSSINSLKSRNHNTYQ